MPCLRLRPLRDLPSEHASHNMAFSRASASPSKVISTEPASPPSTPLNQLLPTPPRPSTTCRIPNRSHGKPDDCWTGAQSALCCGGLRISSGPSGPPDARGRGRLEALQGAVRREWLLQPRKWGLRASLSRRCNYAVRLLLLISLRPANRGPDGFFEHAVSSFQKLGSSSTAQRIGARQRN